MAASEMTINLHTTFDPVSVKTMTHAGMMHAALKTLHAVLDERGVGEDERAHLLSGLVAYEESLLASVIEVGL